MDKDNQLIYEVYMKEGIGDWLKNIGFILLCTAGISCTITPDIDWGRGWREASEEEKAKTKENLKRFFSFTFNAVKAAHEAQKQYNRDLTRQIEVWVQTGHLEPPSPNMTEEEKSQWVSNLLKKDFAQQWSQQWWDNVNER